MPGERPGWRLLRHLEKLALRMTDVAWSGETVSDRPVSTLSPDIVSLGERCQEKPKCAQPGSKTGNSHPLWS